MKLRLTLRAEADIDEIAAYIHVHNPRAAQRVEAEIKAAFRLIRTYPHVGRNVRRFALSRYPYLIFYDVDVEADDVIVFSIRHGARRQNP